MKNMGFNLEKSTNILVDARPLVSSNGGITRYLSEVLNSHASKNVKMTLVSDGLMDPEFEMLLFDSNINVKQALPSFFSESKYLKPLKNFLWELGIIRFFLNTKYDLFWSPRHHLPLFFPKSKPSIVTIHDLIWKTAPKTMPKLNLWSEKLLMPVSLKKATGIICISETTQNILNRSFPHVSKKQKVIKHGEDTFTPNTDKKMNHDFVEKAYILTVGTLEPRKNYLLLIKAFELYRKDGGKLSLRIVGGEGWKFSSIIELAKRSRYTDFISIESSVSDNDLFESYNNASAYISASIDEGFGLPIVEAKKFGLRLALSNTEIYKELFTDDCSIWFQFDSIGDITNSLFQLEKESLVKLNSTQNPVRTWKQCAYDHNRFFKEIIGLN